MGKLKDAIFKSRKSIIITILAIIALLATGVFSYSWYQSTKGTEVTLNTVSKGHMAKSVPITGDIEARSSSTIYPSPTAKIVEVLAAEGQTVKKGDVLARIDSTEYRKQLEKQTITLSNAEATLAYLSGSSSDMDKASAKNAVSQAEIAVTNAQSNYNAAQKNLGDVSTLNDNAVSQVQIVLENAQSNYNAAKGNLDNIGTIYNNNLSQAEIALGNAQSNYDAAVERLQNIEIANNNLVGQAQLALDSAEAHYHLAKKALEDLEAVLSQAECALENAKAASETAKTNLAVVKTLYDSDPVTYAIQYQTALQAVTDTGNAVLNAEMALSSAQNTYNAGYNTAKLAVIDAETAISNAEITLSNAENAADADYDAATKVISDSEAAVRSAEIAFSNAKSSGAIEYDAAVKAVSDSEAAVRSAELTLANANSTAAVRYDAAAKAISDGLNTVRSAEVSLSNAQSMATFTDATAGEKISNQSDQIALLKADIQYLNDKIAENDLKANVDGVVTKMDVKANEFPTAGDAIIVDGATEYVISLAISQFDSVNIRVGQKAAVKVKGIAKEYEGIVSEIGQLAEKSLTSADQNSKVTVKVTITNPDENIKVGYEADAEIILDEKLATLQVNYEAVQIEENTGKKYVFTVDRTNKTEKRYVETGLETDYNIEVLNGLVEGERYIANPDKTIAAGVTVKDSGAGK
jgi:multidrug efflux pump subunit AcrA (membrane-fusion protein)